MIGSAEIGETVMRALILRRVELIEEGAAGTIIIGARDSSAVRRLQNFLGRSGYPYQVLDARGDGEGHDLVERFGVTPDELPLVVCPNVSLLRRPSEIDMARCLPDPDSNHKAGRTASGSDCLRSINRRTTAISDVSVPPLLASCRLMWPSVRFPDSGRLLADDALEISEQTEI